MFKYENVDGPDIDFSTRKIEFPRVNNGNQESLSLSVSNNGNQELTIFNVYNDNIDFSVDAPFNSLAPGEKRDVTVTYLPGINNWRKSVIFGSNDPDETLASLLLQGNFPYGPMPGDLAPNFDLPLVDKVDNNITLESLKGSPTVIAFFTAW